HTIGGAKESAQIEIAFQLDRHILQRNTERSGVQAVCDLLTGCKRRERILHGIGCTVCSPKERRFVHINAEAANAYAPMQAVLAAAFHRERDESLLGMLHERGLILVEDFVQIGRHTNSFIEGFKGPRMALAVGAISLPARARPELRLPLYS